MVTRQNQYRKVRPFEKVTDGQPVGSEFGCCAVKPLPRARRHGRTQIRGALRDALVAELRSPATRSRTWFEEEHGFVVQVVCRLVSALEEHHFWRVGILAGRRRADEHEMTDESRVAGGRGLCGEPAHRPAPEDRLLELQRASQVVRILGHRRDSRRGLARGGAEARVVERDHPIVLGEPVDEGRIPRVERPPETIDQDERRASTDASYGELPIANVDERRRYLGIRS